MFRDGHEQRVAATWWRRACIAWGLLAVAGLASACAVSGGGSGAAFEAVLIEPDPDVDCDDGDRCLRVGGPVIGSAMEVGGCELYGSAGDPSQMQPRQRSGQLVLVGGEPTWWRITVPAGTSLDDLNPLCWPVAEG